MPVTLQGKLRQPAGRGQTGVLGWASSGEGGVGEGGVGEGGEGEGGVGEGGSGDGGGGVGDGGDGGAALTTTVCDMKPVVHR